MLEGIILVLSFAIGFAMTLKLIIRLAASAVAIPVL
jgi:ABC-type nickel/cobalt efflux system permease component RcnA